MQRMVLMSTAASAARFFVFLGTSANPYPAGPPNGRRPFALRPGGNSVSTFEDCLRAVVLREALQRAWRSSREAEAVRPGLLFFLFVFHAFLLTCVQTGPCLAFRSPSRSSGKRAAVNEKLDKLSRSGLARMLSDVNASEPAFEVADLEEWIRAAGGSIGKVSSGVHEGRRGLFTTGDVSAGEVLVYIPKSCLVSVEEADLQPAWGLTLTGYLTASLAGASCRKTHQPYVETLPVEEELLASWKPAELAALQSPRLVDAAKGQRSFVAELLRNVEPWVPQASPDTTKWAENMVRSRSFTFEQGWKGTPMKCMVPFIDLANHQTPVAGELACEPVELQRKGGHEGVVLRAPSDLKRGSEVFITYRYDGNEGLLLDYGFAEERREGSLGSTTVWLEDDVALGTDELDECAVAMLTQRLRKTYAEGTSISDAVRLWLVDACKAAVRRMPTAARDDRIELQQAQPGRRRFALVHRLEKKDQLLSYIKILSQPSPEDLSVVDALRSARL